MYVEYFTTWQGKGRVYCTLGDYSYASATDLNASDCTMMIPRFTFDHE